MARTFLKVLLIPAFVCLSVCLSVSLFLFLAPSLSLLPIPTPAVAWCPGGRANAKAGEPAQADSAASIHAEDAATQTWGHRSTPDFSMVVRA